MIVMAAERILIVDDEEEMLKLLAIELETEGYRVWMARSGQEAIRRATVVRPDLILLDVMLPDITGGDVVKVLRENETTKDTPVIFLTALFSKKEEQEMSMLNVGDQQYLTIAKPVTAQDLHTQIRGALRRRLTG
jgi:DNA-binding response OmpR family regulator